MVLERRTVKIMCFFKKKAIKPSNEGINSPVYDDGYIYFGHYPQSITNNKNENHKAVIYQFQEPSLTLEQVLELEEFYINEKTGEIEINDSKMTEFQNKKIIFSNKIKAINNKKYLFKFERIKWKILFETDDYWLVISDKILDNLQFSNDRDNNNYEDSYIRKWLNEVFVHEAFSEEEQKYLCPCTINLGPESTDIFYTSYTAPGGGSYYHYNKNIYKNIDKSGPIEDKVFLLSYQDLINFNLKFDTNDENSKQRQKYYTDYCICKNISTLHPTADYWTRSKSKDGLKVFYVNKDGNVKRHTDIYNGTIVQMLGVVPALAISKNKNSTAKHVFSYNLPSGVSFSKNKEDILVSEQTITFGKYFQETKNSKTPVLWDLLEETDDYYLLQSRYILDQKVFDESQNTFENSSLRKWLNTEFIEEVFTHAEKKILLPLFKDDKITILSQEELRLNKYKFGISNSGTFTRRKIATKYAINKGLYNPKYLFRMDSGFESWYWTRSPAYEDLYSTKIIMEQAVTVDENGELFSRKKNITNCGVVPVIKLRKIAGIKVNITEPEKYENITFTFQ
jgi:hypothetical protein